MFAIQNRQCFGGGCAGSNNPKIMLGLKQPAEAVPEQAVIVHQQNPDRLCHRLLSCSQRAPVKARRRNYTPGVRAHSEDLRERSASRLETNTNPDQWPALRAGTAGITAPARPLRSQYHGTV